MILIAELINHFVNGIVKMKTVKKVVKKATKKAQYGTSTSMDEKGRYNVVTKSNTPQGPRYYQYAHPNEGTAISRNAALARANSADSIPAVKVNPIDIKKLANQKNGGKTVKKTVKKAQNGKDVPKGYVRGEMTGKLYKKEIMDKWDKGVTNALDKAAGTGKYAPKKNTLSNTAAKKKMKSGGKMMMKRADGSVSQRGLWDNIRAAKGSGKKPTAAMLKQEKKIKLTSKKK